MRLLKTLVLIAVIVLIIFLIVPLFFSPSVVVSESVKINAATETVFRQVNNLQNWTNWSPFVEEDPNLISTYTGPPMGVGATHIWKSVLLGDGQMTITESQPYNFLYMKLDFYDRGTAANEWQFDTHPDGTQVSWTMIFDDLGYPIGRILGIFMPGMMKSYLVNGLDNLKAVAEADDPPTEILEVSVESFAAITIVDSATYDQLATQMGNNFEQLSNYGRIASVDIAGPAFALYTIWDTADYIHYRVGLPVWGEVRESSNVRFYVHPGGNALMATIFGDYQGLGKAHNDIHLFMVEQGLNHAGYPWEVYVKGPADEEDPANWITEIYYPIE